MEVKEEIKKELKKIRLKFSKVKRAKCKLWIEFEINLERQGEEQIS